MPFYLYAMVAARRYGGAVATNGMFEPLRDALRTYPDITADCGSRYHPYEPLIHIAIRVNGRPLHLPRWSPTRHRRLTVGHRTGPAITVTSHWLHGYVWGHQRLGWNPAKAARMIVRTLTAEAADRTATSAY
ncbi:hypothetical protein [Spirillospora albida]|uniref:hypothetical protein n=1 Tax=Spirillospora albida TaxID=58123 RepID=UPI0004C09E9A|nr:hypothetical protein [Spirillospora albida]